MKSPFDPADWSDAIRRKGSPERGRFLESHVDLVKYLALRISARLPSSVELGIPTEIDSQRVGQAELKNCKYR